MLWTSYGSIVIAVVLIADPGEGLTTWRYLLRISMARLTDVAKALQGEWVSGGVCGYSKWVGVWVSG